MSHEIDVETGLPKLGSGKVWTIVPYDVYEDPAQSIFPVFPFRNKKNWVLLHIGYEPGFYGSHWIRMGDPVIASRANEASILKAAIKLTARTKRKEERKRKRDAKYEQSGRELRDQRRAAKSRDKRDASEAVVRAKHAKILGSYPPKKLEAWND